MRNCSDVYSGCDDAKKPCETVKVVADPTDASATPYQLVYGLIYDQPYSSGGCTSGDKSGLQCTAACDNTCITIHQTYYPGEAHCLAHGNPCAAIYIERVGHKNYDMCRDNNNNQVRQPKKPKRQTWGIGVL